MHNSPVGDEVLAEQICSLRLAQLQTAVDAHSERQEHLEYLANLVQMQASPGGMDPDEYGCNLEDPVIFENIISLSSMLQQARSKPPFWLLKPEREEDAEVVARIERYVNARAEEDGLAHHLADIDFMALRDPWAISFLSREQIEAEEHVAVWQYPDGTQLSEEELPDGDPGEARKVLISTPVVMRDHIKFTAVPLADFFMWPPDAPSVNDAVFVCHRFRTTREQLLADYESLGYDEDAVLELVGGSGSGEYQDQYYRNTARLNMIEDHEYIVLYNVFGKLPIIQDETLKPNKFIKENISRDYHWVLCPSKNACLKFVESPYGNIRPFVRHAIHPQSGMSLAMMLEQIAAEMTSNLRFSVDMMNLQVATPLFMQEEDLRDGMEGKQLFKGAIIPYRRQVPVPLTLPQTWQGALSMQQYMEGRAKSLASAQGYQDLSDKVRKATEIDAMSSAVAMKFDLFLNNLQRSMVELGAMYFAMLKEIGDGEVVVSNQNVQVTSEDLQKEIRILPYANSDNYNPTLRMQKYQQLLQMIRSSPLTQLAMQQGDLSKEYALVTEIAEQSGIDMPSRFIPEPPPQPDAIQAVTASIAQTLGIDPGMLMQNPQFTSAVALAIQQGANLPEQQAQQQPMQIGMPGMELPISPEMGGLQ